MQALDMKIIPSRILLKKTITWIACKVLIGLMFMGCSSIKKNKQKTIHKNSNQNTTQVYNNGNTATATHHYDFDDHEFISLIPALKKVKTSNAIDSLSQNGSSTSYNEYESATILKRNSPVGDKIVENYTNSDNKEPNGHCLSVSKGRFEQAFKEVHGHSFYQDLPANMATKSYTPKQVFNLIYDSASDTREGWRSLPETYRGKGNAGAIAYAGMGTLVDSTGIWSGQLQPGALMQVWRFKDDYEKVVQGVNVKNLDPYGHSFIFISYVRDDKKTIIGLKIADQGFQSYRPLVPRDYEVWWAVNLSI
ncbi:hypothetical protein [uncultured Maribacter sp.]|uniref:hypothetical protein n=1 Tax=uncultured Maribacter sp. TaxID=431308 RepID=UPI0030DC1A5B|tara:strand:- start:1000 stop:1920 length:921 start_codon:yes stop_codon:yes gene_type:complete